MIVKNKTINDWVTEIHEYSKLKGWWDNFRPDSEIFALIVSELGEAIEASRDGIDDMMFEASTGKPVGVSTELIDALIRIMDFFGYKGWDMEKILETKHQYNLKRPYRHNKKW